MLLGFYQGAVQYFARLHILILPLIFFAAPLAVQEQTIGRQDIAKWKSILEEQKTPETRLAERDAQAKRQAEAAIALLRLGRADLVWSLLRHSSNSSLRSYLIRDLGQSGISPDVIIKRLKIESDLSVRQALILSLGGFSDDQLPANKRKSLIVLLLKMYREDADSGIHSAIDWLLRDGRQGLLNRKIDWQQGNALSGIDRSLAGQQPEKRNWFITKQGQTLAVIRNPVEFLMGAPKNEPGRDKSDDEAQHREMIPRSFAIATKEVTVGQFQKFLDANPEIKKRSEAAGNRSGTREGAVLKRLNLDDDCPQVSMTWFEAAQYCNWLSQQEGIPETEWCYPTLSDIKEGMSLPKDYLHRTGYRMPTEAEWEYAVRAETTTSRFYGESEELLREYAWFTGTTFNERPWQVGQLKPNDFGLFDVYGSVWEWGQDWAKAYQSEPKDKIWIDAEDENLTVSKDYKRARRGGSYTYSADYLRSAHRATYIPDERRDSVGFRIARTVR